MKWKKARKKPVEIEFPAPCMVCGEPAEMCAPLTFCVKCNTSPEADRIRKEHREWFEKIRKEWERSDRK